MFRALLGRSSHAAERRSVGRHGAVTWDEVLERFMAGTRSEALPLVLNDAVEIVGGPCSGLTGAVITPINRSPQITFSVELETPPYEDTEVPIEWLRLVDSGA